MSGLGFMSGITSQRTPSTPSCRHPAGLIGAQVSVLRAPSVLSLWSLSGLFHICCQSLHFSWCKSEPSLLQLAHLIPDEATAKGYAQHNSMDWYTHGLLPKVNNVPCSFTAGAGSTCVGMLKQTTVRDKGKDRPIWRCGRCKVISPEWSRRRRGQEGPMLPPLSIGSIRPTSAKSLWNL